MPKWQTWEKELVLKMTHSGSRAEEIVDHLPSRFLVALQTYMTRSGVFHFAPPPQSELKVGRRELRYASV